jgi:uncharacterized membrane-anchored protein YitT (DUF2179 family)
MDKLIKLFCGCLVTSIGVIILRHSHVVTGGVAGLSLMISYFLNIQFSSIFFAINIPFYIFSFVKIGWKFTLSTVAAVTILSLMTGIDKWLPLFSIPILIGAVFGGLIIGFGLSIIAINGASLGGTNMVAIFLQKRYNLNPGIMNFIFDFLVVVLSFNSIGISKGILSVLSIATTASIINYFKGRISNSLISKPIYVKHPMYCRDVELIERI